MRSMSAPSDPATAVWYYDGVSARRRTPVLRTQGAGFILADSDVEEGPFAFADLVPHGSVGPHAEYGLRGRPGWRIGFLGDVPDPVLGQLPPERRYGGWIDRIGLWSAAGVLTLLAALVLALVLTTPALLARIVPRGVEQRLGALMIGDFGGRTCNGPGGEAALVALSDRLGPTAAAADIRVVNVPVVNAVALPGGNVLLFDGLIQKAQSPDEVAGVLAHELGHVEHRNVLESLVRQMGLSVLLGGIDGNIGGYTQVLLSAGYSRKAEANADDFAIHTLRDARVSPTGTATFFDRLSKHELQNGRAAALLGYLSSHPLSGERRARFAASAGKQPYRLALSPGDWQALRAICRSDPDVSRSEWRF